MQGPVDWSESLDFVELQCPIYSGPGWRRDAKVPNRTLVAAGEAIRPEPPEGPKLHPEKGAPKLRPIPLVGDGASSTLA